MVFDNSNLDNSNFLDKRICNNECLSFINSFVKENIGKINRTMQIGLSDGMLANTIVDVTQKLHITIDPFQERFNFSGIKLLKSTGNWAYIDYRDDYSYAVLPKMLEGNVLPDFIIIDGDLRFDYYNRKNEMYIF